MKTRNLAIPMATGISLLSCSSPEAPTSPSQKPDPEQDPVVTIPADRPNVVVILMDDVGYSDVGCYGGEINTPNIDRLAENGIRFRNFYNAARSSPTRASLLTGLYPHQAGVGALSPIANGGENYQGYPKENTCMIPEALRSSGYMSFITGKWHLRVEHCAPLKRGFDHSLFTGNFWYFSSDRLLNNDNTLFLEDKGVKRGSPGIPAEFYTSDLWVDQGIKWVDEAIEAGKPFFWYLPFNAVHFPIQVPQEEIDKYVGKYAEGYDVIRNRRWEKQKQLGLFEESDRLTPRNPSPLNTPWEKMTEEQRKQQDYRMAIYAGCLDRADQNIGRALNHLEAKGVLDNTIIIFLSDNGGNAEGGFPGTYETKNGPAGLSGSNIYLGTPWADVANTPFLLYKHHGHEGGCCTPLIISWPAGIDKSLWGTIDKENYGHLVDIMPTICELTGGTYRTYRNGLYTIPAEGVSLAPSLRGERVMRTNPIIVEHEGNKMLRDGDWKIAREYELVNGRESTEEENPWRLYNLRTDPTEMTDLATQEPARLKSMVDKYKAWADHIGVNTSIKFSVGKWYTPVRNYPLEDKND